MNGTETCYGDMTVSQALCIAEELAMGAEAHARLLFGRDQALVVLAKRVRELNVEKGVQK
jgi:hypothetical protein